MNRYKVILKTGKEIILETKRSLYEIQGFMNHPFMTTYQTDGVVIVFKEVAAIIKFKERELTEDEIKEKLRGK